MKNELFYPALAAFTYAVIVAVPSAAGAATHITHDRHMTVFKSPTCGCCSAWVRILTNAGFEIEVRDTDNLRALNEMAGIPEAYWACHSAKIGQYNIEGHVPVAAIDKLLTEQPDILGIAVPGMPDGAPGMGNNPNAVYDVLVIDVSSQNPKNIYMRIGE